MLACRSSTWVCTWKRFMGWSLFVLGGAVHRGGVEAAGALAAVLGQVAEQRVHPVVRRPVDEIAAGPRLGPQSGVGQFLQMEGQRGGGDVERIGHRARREAGPAGHYKRAKHPQAQWLRQSGKRADRVGFLHASTILEITKLFKRFQITPADYFAMASTRSGARHFHPRAPRGERLRGSSPLGAAPSASALSA